MSLTRVKPSGWVTNEKLTSAQINNVDINITYALDKRSGQTDTLASVITVASTGQVIFDTGSELIFNNSLIQGDTSVSLLVNSGSDFTFTGTILQGSIFADLTVGPFSQITFSDTGIQGTIFTSLHLITGSQLTFDAGSGVSFSGSAQTTSGSTFTFNGNSSHTSGSSETFLSGSSLLLNFGSTLTSAGTTTLNGVTNVNGSISLNGTTTTTGVLNCNGPINLIGSTSVSGSLTATTSAVTMADFTLTGTNKVKLVSRTYTRKIGAIMERAIPTDWDSVVGAGGIFETSSVVGAQGFFPIRLPSGAIISSIRLYIAPAMHVNLPASMPIIQLVSVSNGASTLIATQTDPSTTVAAYNAYHAIQLSGLGYTVNNNNESLRLLIITELGAGSVSDCQVWDAEVTFSVTSIDDGFAV
jgi:hypothetical protein